MRIMGRKRVKTRGLIPVVSYNIVRIFPNTASRVKTRRGVSGPKMDLLCEPDV